MKLQEEKEIVLLDRVGAAFIKSEYMVDPNGYEVKRILRDYEDKLRVNKEIESQMAAFTSETYTSGNMELVETDNRFDGSLIIGLETEELDDHRVRVISDEDDV